MDMMNQEDIRNLEDLIILGPDQKIIDYKIKRLTAPGENYGSLMLKLDITVATPSGTEEIETVAKKIPLSDSMQELFNVQQTFPNEIGFYKKIFPLLQDFQREHGVKKVMDVAPKYYGSRLNLTGGDKIDEDAVLILENLKSQNYINFERTIGFDLDTSRLILEDLAYLHAVPLAVKLQKPEIFESEIKKYLVSFNFSEEQHKKMTSRLLEIAATVAECWPFLNRVRKTMEVYPFGKPAREPFATICHNDCWVNNTMVQVIDGKSLKNKLVDFQLCGYGSPANDVLFFLFSSVKNEILKKNYDDLIKFYHDTFIRILEELHCDTTAFNFEAFQEELNFEAKYSQFAHLLPMLNPIFAPRNTIKDIADLKVDNIGIHEPTKLHKEKLAFVVKEFAKRNWI